MSSGQLFCLHCDAVWEYYGDFRAPSVSYRRAMREALAHDAVCDKNPLVQRIRELEAEAVSRVRSEHAH